MPNNYKTLIELAQLTSIPYDTLVKAAREGRLDARKSGGVWLSTLEAVEEARKSGGLR